MKNIKFSKKEIKFIKNYVDNEIEETMDILQENILDKESKNREKQRLLFLIELNAKLNNIKDSIEEK